MQSNFAHLWSTALGLNVSALSADSAGVSRLTQSMVDFLQARSANTVMDKINSELKMLHSYGEDIRLKLDYGNGMVINDETRRLADAFLVEAKDAVQGKWPQAWGDDLKEPLMLFVAYASANNVLAGEQRIDWSKTVPIMSMTYAKEKGPEKMREQINSIDQFLPQVLIGTAMALLSLESIPAFNEKIHDFTAKQAPGAKPQPIEFLDILLEARNAHLAAGTPAPAQP